MISIFKYCKLKVTTEENVTVTECLDVYFDLRKEIFKPYRKNNEIPAYINAKSNHPRSIKRELPKKEFLIYPVPEKFLRMNENPIWMLYIKRA